MARLLVEDPLGRRKVFELEADEVVVGRAADAALVLEDGHASRRHAAIARDSGRFIIRDLNSGNGLFVNGERVSQTQLTGGDVIQVGHSRLVFDDAASLSGVRFAEHDAGQEAVLVRRIEDAASPGNVSMAGAARRTDAEQELDLLRKKARILTLMYELGKTLKGVVSVDQVYREISALLLDVCAAERVLVLEVDESASGLTVAHQASGSDHSHRTVSRTVTRKVLGDRVTLLSTNASIDPALSAGQSIVMQQIHSVICAPLLVRDEVQGLIYLDQQKVGAFSAEELDVVNAVAAQAAIALENVHALKRLAREAEARAAYSRFLPAHVVEDLLKNPETLRPGGANQIATVLFADIRGFTRMSARMGPEEVVRILNDYFSEMTEVIFEHGGTLDKYIGDGLMALFGAPYAGPDDAIQAVRAAIAMQQRMEALKPPSGITDGIGIGIGINTGIVTVGYVGSMRRFDYTAIGDTVNIASRLESSAPAGEIYIAQTTFSELRGEFPCAELRIAVKGRDEPLDCLRVLWK
jgi:adenylate cyclase